MDERVRSFLITAVALLFLAGLGAFLARPVFQSDDPQPTSTEAEAPQETPEPSRIKSPQPTKSPKPRDTAIEGLVLGDRYPRSCLDRVDGPAGTGMIATLGEGRIEVGTLGSVTARLRGESAISWSPSGRYLAIDGDAVYDSRTGERGPLLGVDLRQWAWSPTSDCVAGATNKGELVAGRPGTKGVTIVEQDVETFSFARSGRYVHVFLGKDGTVIDLKRHEEGPRVRLDPKRCRDLGRRIYEETCSANGEFIAAVRDESPGPENVDGRLVLFQGERFVRTLTTGDYSDRVPEWGPPRTGILFVRIPEGDAVAEVWFLPEGGSPGRTPYRTGGEGFGYAGYPWNSYLDWSATPPDLRPF